MSRVSNCSSKLLAGTVLAYLSLLIQAENGLSPVGLSGLSFSSKTSFIESFFPHIADSGRLCLSVGAVQNLVTSCEVDAVSHLTLDAYTGFAVVSIAGYPSEDSSEMSRYTWLPFVSETTVSNGWSHEVAFEAEHYSCLNTEAHDLEFVVFSLWFRQLKDDSTLGNWVMLSESERIPIADLKKSNEKSVFEADGILGTCNSFEATAFEWSHVIADSDAAMVTPTTDTAVTTTRVEEKPHKKDKVLENSPLPRWSVFGFADFYVYIGLIGALTVFVCGFGCVRKRKKIVMKREQYFGKVNDRRRQRQREAAGRSKDKYDWGDTDTYKHKSKTLDDDLYNGCQVDDVYDDDELYNDDSYQRHYDQMQVYAFSHRRESQKQQTDASGVVVAKGSLLHAPNVVVVQSPTSSTALSPTETDTFSLPLHFDENENEEEEEEFSSCSSAQRIEIAAETRRNAGCDETEEEMTVSSVTMSKVMSETGEVVTVGMAGVVVASESTPPPMTAGLSLSKALPPLTETPEPKLKRRVSAKTKESGSSSSALRRLKQKAIRSAQKHKDDSGCVERGGDGSLDSLGVVVSDHWEDSTETSTERITIARKRRREHESLLGVESAGDNEEKELAAKESTTSGLPKATATTRGGRLRRWRQKIGKGKAKVKQSTSSGVLCDQTHAVVVTDPSVSLNPNAVVVVERSESTKSHCLAVVVTPYQESVTIETSVSTVASHWTEVESSVLTSGLCHTISHDGSVMEL